MESLHHFFIIRVDIPDQFEKLTATHVVDVFDVSEAFEGINYRRDSWFLGLLLNVLLAFPRCNPVEFQLLFASVEFVLFREVFHFEARVEEQIENLDNAMDNILNRDH